MSAATIDPLSPSPYLTAAEEYLTAGWWPLPVLGDDKARVPGGFTGYKGRAVTRADVKRWNRDHPDRNLAIRLPRDVVCLDVDHYGDKRGGDTLAKLEEELGPLPPTVVATARPLPSGKRLYRVPVGSCFRGTAGPGVDIVSWHCRYVVAWPSVHHSGAAVQWIDEPSGEVLDTIPEPGDLPDLPWSWLERLSASGSRYVAAEATGEEVTAWLAECTEARRPGWLAALTRSVEERLAAGAGRHPTMLAALCDVAREASAGAYRAADAAEALREVWDRYTAGENREGEFDDELVPWAVGQLAAEDGPERVAAIRERITGRVELLAPVSDEPAPEDPGPVLEDPAPWPELVPLDGSALPAFPVDALPAWAGEYVTAMAAALQVPTDLAGVLFLGTVAAVTTGRVAVRVNDGYREPLIGWFGLIADPGERKSPALAAVTGPLRAEEAALAEAVAAERDRLGQERRILDRRAEAAETAAAKAPPAEALAAMQAAADARAEALAVVVPPEPRFLADDATPEALVRVAAEQGGRIALVSAEPGPLADMGRRYGTGSAWLDPYLKGWGGEPVRLDRVGRNGEHLAEFSVSLCVCLQPTAAAAIHGDGENRGRGIVGRVLWSWPATILGHRDPDPPPVPATVAKSYDARLRELAVAAGVHTLTEGVELTLSPEAERVRVAFAAEVEPRLHPTTGDLAGLDGWASKLPGQVVRLAGLLHVAEYGTAGEVDAVTMAAAADLGRYLTAHALRLWGEAGGLADLNGARKVLRWLNRAHHLEGGTFTLRDVHRGAFGHGRDATADELRDYLAVLAERGYVRPVPQEPGARSGRPSEVFRPRPGLNGPQVEGETSSALVGASPVVSGDVGAFEEDL